MTFIPSGLFGRSNGGGTFTGFVLVRRRCGGLCGLSTLSNFQ